jgi:Fe-Mn family superoxide dismutase
MTYQILPLTCDIHSLDGLSERLISSHHENNYSGAVKRLNAITEQLQHADFGTLPGFELNGLKREELIAANSMILHELYFDCIGGAGGQPEGELLTAIERDFTSFERWLAEFTAMGKALGGGSGWVLLSWSGRDRKLVNQWASDHCHSLAMATPLLALDMYEHAYHMDFGAKAGVYVDTFMRNINWDAVQQRFSRIGRDE